MKQLFCVCLVALAVGCSPDKPIYGTVIGKHQETVNTGRSSQLGSFITVVETNRYEVTKGQYLTSRTGTVVYIEK